MSDPIKFYFACFSPWSYLALDGLKSIAEKHGREVVYKPTHVGRQWQETSAGRPLGDRPEVLQAYRLIDLPRWAAWRDVPLNTEPKHFPAPFLLSSCVIIAAGQTGAEMYEITRALMRGCWAEERNIGDPDDVAAIADAIGLDGGLWWQRRKPTRSWRSSRPTPTNPSPMVPGACRPSSWTANSSSARTAWK
jgi:2-hydroxychromene-2-carboxylate isomerase